LFPTLLLILGKPSKSLVLNISLKELFWKYSLKILIIVNLSALITFSIVHFQDSFISPVAMDLLDDSFYGLYGKSGLGGHVLSIINIIYAIRYFFIGNRQIGILFLVFSILGFYGLGLVLTIISLTIIFRKYLLAKINFKYLLMAITLLVSGVFLIKSVNPKNYEYIKNSVFSFVVVKDFDYKVEMHKANNLQTTSIPRKLTFIIGTFNRIKEDPYILFFGTSPGTYNSRVAFLLNGDLSKTKLLKDNIRKRPPFHQSDVYPLFNTKTTLVPWMGGTRNQPFSSIISVFIEYGVILGFLIFYTFYLFGFQIIRLNKNSKDQIALKFIFILSIFLFFFVYYLEVIEYVLPVLLLFKVYQVDAYDTIFLKSKT